MILHVVKCSYIEGFKLYLHFNDGTEGEINLEKFLWGNAFKPLQDLHYFQKVKLNKKIGTICWPNEVDFAPEFLKQNLEKKSNYAFRF